MKIELWHVYLTEDIKSINLIKQGFNKLWEFKINKGLLINLLIIKSEVWSGYYTVLFKTTSSMCC